MKTQELNALKELVSKMLLEKGCTKEDDDNKTSEMVFSLDSKYIITKYSFYSNFCEKFIESTYHDGLALELYELYRSNGTQRNCSIILEVCNYKSSKYCDGYSTTAHLIHRVKIYERFSIKKIEKLVNEIIQAYKDAE